MTNSLFEPPFWGLKGNVADFLFTISELCSPALTVHTL